MPEELIKTYFGKQAADLYGTGSTVVSLGGTMFDYYDNYSKAKTDNGRDLAKMMYAYSVTSLCIAAAISSINPLAGIIWGITTGVVGKILQDMLEKYYAREGYLRLIIDPSGIVYEAVLGNPVEGATVTVYFKDQETGETIKWNAEDYDQINPLLTDKEGKYLWDVPEGQWKVVCEKEGYETVETDWFDIPPVRTDVNIALINKDIPVIENANMVDTGITIKFNKFVDISTVTVNNLILEGFDGEYTITPNLIDENDKYADTFILSGDFTNQIKSISITDKIVSYAGTSAKASSVAVSSDTTNKLGDVNDDGKINAVDASTVLTYYANVSTNKDGGFTDSQKKVADVNNDGVINAVDASCILSYYAYSSTTKEEIISMEDYMQKAA